MQIEHIDLVNFKSYTNQSVQDISKGINVFLGRNGHGKSNLFSSLDFLFTDKAQISKIKNYYNQNAEQQGKKDPIQVSVQFSNPENDDTIPQNLRDFTFKREWTHDQHDSYYIKENKASKAKVENALNIIGISKQNAYNIVQQGSIRQVQKLDEQGIYGLLEEVTGVKQFLKKEQETYNLLKTIKKEKYELSEIFQEIENKINDLEHKQSDYQTFEDNRNHVKVLKYLLIDEQIKILKKKLNEKEDKIQNLNRKESANNNQDKDDTQLNEINNLKQQLKAKSSELRNLMQLQSQLEQQINEKNSKIQDINLTTTNKTGDTQDTQPQNDMEIESDQNLLQEIKEKEQEKEQIDQQLQKLNDDYQQQDQLLNPLLTKKSMNTNTFNSKQERDTNIKQQIQQIEQSLNDKIQKQEQYKQQLNEQNQIKTSVVNKLEEEKNKLQEFQKNQSKINDTINEINKNLQKIRHEAIEEMQKNHVLLQEQENLEQQMLQKQKIIESISRQPVLQSINNLERELMKRNQHDLIVGKLIDFIKIDDKHFNLLKNPIDLALKNKLFTFIVKNNEDAQKLIDINKEINNSAIQIYNIEWIQDKMKNYQQIKYPETNSIVILQNMVNAQVPNYDQKNDRQKKEAQIQQIYLPDIKNLLKFLLAKFILVDKYEDATEYSQEYQVTSITKDLDIVYPDSFLSKIGTNFSKNNKLEVYKEYKNLMDKYMVQMRESMSYKQTKQQLENKENSQKQKQGQLMLEYKKNSQLIEESNVEIKSITTQKMSIESQIDNISQLNNKYEVLIVKQKAQKQSLENQMKQPFNQKLTNQEQEQIQQLQKQINETKEKLSKQMVLKRDNANELQNLKSLQIKQNNNISASQIDDSQKLELKILKYEIKANQEDFQKNKQQIDKIQKEFKLLQNEFSKKNQLIREQNEKSYKSKEDVEDDINTELIKKQEIELQLDERVNEQNILGDVKSFQAEIYKKLQKLTLKEIKQMLREKTEKDKHRYTAKDETTFKSLGKLKDKHQEFSTRKQNLEKDYQSLKNLLKNNKKQCEQAVQKVFPNFKKYFMKYFRKIVPTGKVEILKSHFQKQETQTTQRSRNQSKKQDKKDSDNENSDSDSDLSDRDTLFRDKNQTRQGIKIKLSFDESNPIQEWHALSDGQKTVVAIVLLFSLQKIDPAPFYVFDEIDAALDTNYREKIIEIISENSSNAQYLISTFKSEWSRLKDAKFFQITSKNNISNVQVISQKQAEDVLKQTEQEENEKQNENHDMLDN